MPIADKINEIFCLTAKFHKKSRNKLLRICKKLFRR
jgi:hypothetical protein